MQPALTCAYATDIKSKNRILQVDCGPGRASVMFAEYFLCNRGVLVSCDKNEYNIPKIIKNYDESSFGNVDGNCYLVETEDYTQTNIAVK